MWKVLFGFSSLLCLIVIVFILIKMAREVILLSTATLPKGGGWGGGAHGAETEPDARLEAFYHHSLPLCLILSLRTSREVQATFKDRKKDWDSPLGGRRVKIFQAFFFF